MLIDCLPSYSKVIGNDFGYINRVTLKVLQNVLANIFPSGTYSSRHLATSDGNFVNIKALL
jgi:hypothetical protein